MNAFIEPIQAMTEFQEIRTWLREKSGSGILEITGCIDPQKLHLIYCLSGDAYKIGRASCRERVFITV